MSDPQINPETGETMQGRSPRFTIWVALLIFSCITMGAAVEVKNGADDPGAASKWAVTCSIISFVLAALIVIAHLIPIASTMVVGTRLEGVLSLVLAAFWAATVAIVTNANNDLGVSDNATNQVQNGNLYYGSWAGFITSIILLVNYLRAAFGVDVVGEVRNRSARLSLWGGMLASALIVMGSSARIFNNDCPVTFESPDNVTETYCKRTKFAIANGSVSVFFTLLIVGMKFFTYSAPFVMEFATAIILLIMNAFSVAFTTSAKGPGSPIGNLYYSSWICFVISAFVAADCFNNKGGGGDASDQQKNDQNGDIEVENLQEDQI